MGIFGMISMNMAINVMSSVCVCVYVKLRRRQSKKVWEKEHYSSAKTIKSASHDTSRDILPRNTHP